jgi:hypothetical protein
LQIFENITKREFTDIGFTFLNIAVLAYLVKFGFKSMALLRSTVIICGWNLVLFVLVMLNFDLNTTESGYVRNYIVDNPISYNFSDNFTGERTDYIDTYRNLALLKNRPGVSSFHSMFNAQVLYFRCCIDNGIFCPTLMMSWHRESIATLMSVRHVYDFKYDHWTRSHYLCGLSRPLGIYGERRDFCYFIPIGFAYDSYVPESDVIPLIADADSINIPLIMLNNIVVADSDTAVFSNYLARGHIDFASASDTTVSRLAANLKEVSEKRRRLTVEGFRGTTRGFTANSDFPDTTVVFFSVADDPGFTAYLTDSIGNRVATPIYRANLGMSGIIVPKGKHTICFDYFPPGLKLGAILSLLGVALLVMLFVLPSRRVVRNEASCQH